MIIEWIQHIKDPDERQKFINQILSARPVLERLNEMFEKREEAMDKNEASLSDFDNPNWAYKQAFRNGYRSCLFALNKYTILQEKRDDQSIRSTQSGRQSSQS